MDTVNVILHGLHYFHVSRKGTEQEAKDARRSHHRDNRWRPYQGGGYSWFNSHVSEGYAMFEQFCNGYYYHMSWGSDNRTHHLPGLSIFAGANFLPAKPNRASPRDEHLANLPLGTIITILKESLTTPLGRRDPFWLIWKHVVFKLRHHYFGPSGGVLPLSCCCPFILV